MSRLRLAAVILLSTLLLPAVASAQTACSPSVQEALIRVYHDEVDAKARIAIVDAQQMEAYRAQLADAQKQLAAITTERDKLKAEAKPAAP